MAGLSGTLSKQRRLLFAKPALKGGEGKEESHLNLALISPFHLMQSRGLAPAFPS